MARIKHIALFSENPAKLAQFYVECFGMKITGESQGDVWVTDGYVDVALLSRKSEKAPKVGVNHWGFTLEDEAEKAKVYEKLKARGLAPWDPRKEDPTIDRPFVEEAARDVDGNRYDLSLAKREMDEEKRRTAERLKELSTAK
jgi:hypothetical protein